MNGKVEKIIEEVMVYGIPILGIGETKRKKQGVKDPNHDYKLRFSGTENTEGW